MADKWTKISALATIILIGIPTAVDFYPPLLAGFGTSLPLDFIFTWMSRAGILALGFTLGWYLRTVSDILWTEQVDRIDGCIEKNGIAWKGTAHLSNGDVTQFNLPYKPMCPKCQTPVNKNTVTPSAQQRRTNPKYSQSAQATKIWSCPNGSCGHTAKREPGQHNEAEGLFENNIKKIAESQDEDYSLQNLLDRFDEDEEVTSEGIWEKYDEVVDDDHVSTNCFH